jgi:DNA polymerase IIIc chi subunit
MPDYHGLTEKRIKALKSEIAMAKAVNKEELTPILQENIQRYIGNYIPAFGIDWDVVLNEVYPIVQASLPAIFFRNPRAFLKPRNKTFIAKKRDPVSGNMVEVELDSAKSAKTQEDILNYTLVEIKYKKQVRKVLLDALLFPHGVLWHGYKGDFGMTEENSIFIKNDRVFVQRINPLRFIKDPAVNMANLEEARWVGRTIDIPLEDLVEDDKLDVDKKLVKGFKGYGESIGTATQKEGMAAGGKDLMRINAARRSMLEFADRVYQESQDAKFVQVHEIYLRPTKKEAREGKKGWILLITDEQDKPLRVNQWTIKAEGFPAHILQFNELPDSPFGLSDPETYKDIADQKNTIVNLQLRNAQENSKVWVALAKGATNEEEIDQVMRGEQTIIAFEGDSVRDRLQVSSPGGAASSELYLLDQRIDRQLQDKSGITDLKKGFLQSGEESATSVRMRNAGSSARPAYRQDIMAEFLKDSLHLINQYNKQFIPYEEAVRIVGSLDLEWSDNPTKEELQADTDVEIDVISMLPEDPDKEMQELQTILMLMVQALTVPEVGTKIAKEGKTFNISPVIEQMLMRLRLRDPEIFRNIKPEESQGFVSVAEVRAAKDNVTAALSGNPNIPSPPQAGQDHVARLEVYSTIQQVIGSLGDTIANKILTAVMQAQMMLLQAEMDKEAKPGTQPKLNKPMGVK